jgi:phosphoribosylformylglycinamidine synthase
MEAVELMISESQERMVAVVTPDRLAAVEEVCDRWELPHAVVGEVTGTCELRAFFAGEPVGTIPVRLLTDECPRYQVEAAARTLEEPVAPGRLDASGAALVELLRTPNVASREPVWRRYDHLVGSRTVRRPGLDAAVLSLRPGTSGLAVSLDAAGRLAFLDPRAGGALAVLEAARNVACAGGRPLAITDCLNFGNPEKPEIAWELAEAIEGISLACETLGVPVVSGNVSLYNETDGRAIYPTPAVGCVGLVEDVRSVPGRWREGDAVLVAGDPELRLDGSEYQARFLGGPAGRPPSPDLAAERALIEFLWRHAAVVTAAHDAAEGGLAVALAELALWSGVGAEVDLGPDAVRWFGEGGGIAVVACRPDEVERLGDVPLERVGTVGGDGLLGVPLDELRTAYDGGLSPT